MKRPNRFINIVFVCSLLFVRSSFALGIDAPDFTDGNYTVTYSGCLNLQPGTIYCQLEERVGTGGNWNVVTSYPQTTAAFSGKPEGEYFYRAHEYIFVMGGNPYEPEPIFSHYYSQEVRVFVTYDPIPVPDTIEDQLNYTYETRIGDIDGDGLDDIFLDRTSGGDVGNGSLDAVILQNLGNGSFTPLVPTSTQLTQVSGWQIAAVQLIFDDLNADGYLDVLLKSLGSVVSGALDQMLFAPSEILAYQPKGIRDVDSHLEDFVNDVAAYQLNDNYFAENAVLVESGYWNWEVICYFIYWYGEWELFCEPPYPVWVEYSYYDYSNFSSEAVDVWQAVENFENGTGLYQAIWEIFEAIFGVEIAGDSFCTDVILTHHEIENEDDCKGLSISAALEAVRRAIAQLEAEPDIQFGRETGLVYVTGHRVFKIGPYHTAVEYRIPVLGIPTTISASCHITPCLTSLGRLESGLDRPTDLPSLNTKVAVVNSVLPPLVYFEKLKEARVKYRDCLRYGTEPAATVVADYNSNSFTAGIIMAEGGIPDFTGTGFGSMSYFIGGETPVPSIEFTDQAPACP